MNWSSTLAARVTISPWQLALFWMAVGRVWDFFFSQQASTFLEFLCTHNLIERLFQGIKQRRRVATRYAKLAAIYLPSGSHSAAACQCIRPQISLCNAAQTAPAAT